MTTPERDLAARAAAASPEPIDRRIARRLAALRAENGWSLDVLAGRTGISRATLSRLERGELSATASMLNVLCAQYGWTLSRLMADAEAGPPTVVRAEEQVSWTDPGTGYSRRMISPPHPSLKAELVEVVLPAGKSVAYDSPPAGYLEHHLWIQAGSLLLEVDGAPLRLRTGDCARYVVTERSRYAAEPGESARYLLALVSGK